MLLFNIIQAQIMGRVRYNMLILAQHDIIRMRILLKYPPDMSNGGNFELPFKFQIPNQLPSSFRYQVNGGLCSIRYKVKIDMGIAKKD